MAQRHGKQRPPLSVVFGSNVFAIRKDRGWSQERLSGASGLTRGTIDNVEKSRDPARGPNETRLDTVEAIALAFDMDPADLLRWDRSTTRAWLKLVS